jgi:hypothetical protein
MLGAWNRYQVGRIVLGVVLIWMIGAGGLHLAEGHTNAAFHTLGESLWSV